MKKIKDNLMMHEDPVICVEFSRDSELLASGSQDGKIKPAKQNPQVMRLIHDHQSEFLRLVNEPAEGVDSNLLGQLGDAMPQSVTVTPEESEAIEREALENSRREVIVAMMKSFPQLLGKSKVSPLVDIIVHFKLELYSLKRQEQNLKAILELVTDAIFKHGEGLHRICKEVKREDYVSSEAYYPLSMNPMLTEGGVEQAEGSAIAKGYVGPASKGYGGGSSLFSFDRGADTARADEMLNDRLYTG